LIPVALHGEDGEENARSTSKKAAPARAAKSGVQEPGGHGADPDRTDSESDDSM